MAAAATAAKYGMEVVVLDEQQQCGGQIYRNVTKSPLPEMGLLGKDYEAGIGQTRIFEQSAIDYHTKCAVWYLDRTRSMGILKNGTSNRFMADNIIIATGAQERPMPIPGWQLPGVMSAGAGQILFKSAAMVPDRGVVMAGSGPLLLLLVWQYLRAGVSIRAILETAPSSNRVKALSHLPKALSAGEYLWKGLRLMMSIRKARIPIYKNVCDLRAEGDTSLQLITFTSAGRTHTMDAALLLLHLGIIPGLHLPQAAECEMSWDDAQQCWVPRVDPWGQSSRDRIYIVGDGAGIEGATAARFSGQLAGLQVACETGYLDSTQRDQLAAPIRKARNRHRLIRPFLDALYRIPESNLNPPDETMVCRCEEISAGEIREVVQAGCIGPNQVKAFTRCGMGPCQGRMCADTVAWIIAMARGESMFETGRYRVRPPLKPITLGQISRTI
jgi:NADPH-dependent 2,4-dienoyl-CoA reductase/sulfur reductase-like enzyme